jgi:hypothetical protein
MGGYENVEELGSMGAVCPSKTQDCRNKKAGDGKCNVLKYRDFCRVWVVPDRLFHILSPEVKGPEAMRGALENAGGAKNAIRGGSLRR